MRSKNAVYNLVFSITYELMLVILGLIFPRLIINVFGSSVNGLTQTIAQILQLLSLLQAGAIGASIFQLFKPVAEKDYNLVGSIMSASRRYFTKIGVVFLVLVVVFAPILALAGDDSGILPLEKVLAFAILGLNGSFCLLFF